MKIAHVIAVFPPYKSGISNTGFYQAKKTADKGHDVVVFTPNYDGRADENPGKINFEVERLNPVLKFGRAAFLPQLLWKLKKFDVVHLHYPFFGGHEVVWLAKKLGIGGKKLVIYYHMDFIAPNLFLKMMSFPSRVIYNSLLKMADKIVVSSFDYISQLGVKDFYKKHQNKFKEIALGSQFNKMTPQKGLEKKEKIILFVGGMDEAHRFKGVAVLIKAFKKVLEKISTSRLVLVGEGELKEEYKQLSKDLGIRHSIDFTSNVMDSELSEYYYLSDVVVLPSVTSGEAFGLVLVEAMAHSKPIIASELPGVRMVCRDQNNGLLVKPGDIDDLAKKIITVLSNPDTAAAMGEKGRQMVQEVFNWDRHVDELISVYHGL